MKKIIFSIIITIILCSALTVSTFAESDNEYIFGVDDYITSDEIININKKAEKIHKNYGIEPYLAVTDNTEEKDTISYAEDKYKDVASGNDGLILTITNDEWYIYTSGKATSIFSDSDIDKMWDAFENAPTDYKSIESYYNEILSQLNNKDSIKDGERLRIVDSAHLLTESEKETLLSKLNEISEKQQFDVIIVTTDSLNGKTAEAYADDFYDYNGYGIGYNKDGALLLISMENRDWHVSTCGYGITAITDAGLNYISDKFLPDLKKGNYYSAFDIYATLCDEFVTQAKIDKPYDNGNLPKKSISLFWIPGSLLIGAVIAFIPLLIMKSRLKTVRSQASANNYVCKDSLNISESRDMFLYSHIDKKEKPKNNNGGSDTHVSSSGSTHGGNGGKF